MSSLLARYIMKALLLVCLRFACGEKPMFTRSLFCRFQHALRCKPTVLTLAQSTALVDMLPYQV